MAYINFTNLIKKKTLIYFIHTGSAETTQDLGLSAFL